jgi:type VI secretion system VasD/TssJ family lipoprotein
MPSWLLQRRFFRTAVVMSTFLWSCGGGQRPSCRTPDALVLELETSDRVNTDESGQALPTVVRIFQLSDISELEMASFDDIWTNSEKVLGKTLMGNLELTIFPGQRTVQRLTRNPKAFFVAAAAVFRRPAGTGWRTIQELPPPGDPCAETGKRSAGEHLKALRMRIYLEGYRIESAVNFRPRPKGSCRPDDPDCEEGVSDSVPSELGPARPGQGLRPYATKTSDGKKRADRERAPSTTRVRRSNKSSPNPRRRSSDPASQSNSGAGEAEEMP